MDSLIDICKDKLVGYYSGVDRLRISGTLRRLQQPGAVVNFMKALYPDEQRPLRHFADLTQRFKAGVEALVARGIPYLEAKRVSDTSVLKWLEPLYAAGPRAGSLVAIVRTIETVASFSCRPRKHRRAKGDPRSGRRPVEEASHHLSRQPHNVAVYYFYVLDTHWGRASVRICSYLPFDVSLQLNGHEYLERQLRRQRRQITMAANAVAAVADWPALRELATANLEPAVRRFAAYWLARLPHGLLPAERAALGEYHWCIQTVEICRNFIFRSVQDCQPVFETLLRHNQLVGSPDTIRVLFGLRHRPHRPTSSQLTLARPMACFKAFYGSHWVKCYDKQGFILRFEVVMNCVTDFVANKSLSNLHYLSQLGRNVCRRLERSCVTAVSCPVSSRAYQALIEPGTDAHGRRYPAIRPERTAQQALLATMCSLAHCANGFSLRELRTKYQQQHGVPLKPSQASYRLRTLRAHGLVEPVGGRRRYQLTAAGRPIMPFLVKLYSHLLAPVVHAATDGIHHFHANAAADPIADAIHQTLSALGLARPLPLAA